MPNTSFQRSLTPAGFGPLNSETLRKLIHREPRKTKDHQKGENILFSETLHEAGWGF